MENKISICIPTYEMNGKGSEYLEYSFNKILTQTYTNIEIIISDNSKTDVIESLCNKWKDKINIKHYYNKEKCGMSANTNYCIKKASGEIIKILYQDDFLLNDSSLEAQLIHFVGNNNYWSVTACAHTKDGINIYNPHYPKYNEDIHYGQNTISCPSVLMFKNKDIIEFDENITWMMDVDYYKRLYDKFGLPSICNYITVVNREHSNQTSSGVNSNIKNTELEYIKNKYK
jgi:glycosyltransferase involved in cell wall biosynthesis